MSGHEYRPVDSPVHVRPVFRFFFIVIAVALVGVALSAPAVTIAASLTLATVIPALGYAMIA
ncbi:hypothetical protein [Flaviflexus huanghaiensis]|uniref:hypothetical protein n=1 Tax=Flaviflexus huanghaiensis TaxID=1111473 RepID=UPI0015F7E20C|nr:hypothetical protein [Flaviflexus huanghaiensis]